MSKDVAYVEVDQLVGYGIQRWVSQRDVTYIAAWVSYSDVAFGDV